GVVDEVVGPAPPAARVGAGLAVGIAEQHARQPQLGIAAAAAVDIALIGAGHRLPVVVVAGVGAGQPVAERDGVVGAPAVGAPAGTVEERAPEVDVGQVVPAGGVVHRQRGPGLQLAGGPAAAVVERQLAAQARVLLP